MEAMEGAMRYLTTFNIGVCSAIVLVFTWFGITRSATETTPTNPDELIVTVQDTHGQGEELKVLRPDGRTMVLTRIGWHEDYEPTLEIGQSVLLDIWCGEYMLPKYIMKLDNNHEIEYFLVGYKEMDCQDN